MNDIAILDTKHAPIEPFRSNDEVSVKDVNEAKNKKISATDTHNIATLPSQKTENKSLLTRGVEVIGDVIIGVGTICSIVGNLPNIKLIAKKMLDYATDIYPFLVARNVEISVSTAIAMLIFSLGPKVMVFFKKPAQTKQEFTNKLIKNSEFRVKLANANIKQIKHIRHSGHESVSSLQQKNETEANVTFEKNQTINKSQAVQRKFSQSRLGKINKSKINESMHKEPIVYEKNITNLTAPTDYKPKEIEL